MKTHEILYEEQHYQIISIERDSAPSHGTFKQGFIKARFKDLVKLFGNPDSHINDDRADVNYSWDLLIKYKDPLNDDHQNYEEDFDQIEVSIYDYRYSNEDRYTNPETINQWTVGAKSREGLWILMDYLKSKGL